MSADINIFEKIVNVTEIRSTQKIETGELMYQVVFSEYLNRTAINPATNEKIPITIPAIWFALNVEAKNISRYRIGSKWKIATDQNNTTSIVELK
jgi:uncharacterized membrane protein